MESAIDRYPVTTEECEMFFEAVALCCMDVVREMDASNVTIYAHDLPRIVKASADATYEFEHFKGILDKVRRSQAELRAAMEEIGHTHGQQAGPARLADGQRPGQLDFFAICDARPKQEEASA